MNVEHATAFFSAVPVLARKLHGGGANSITLSSDAVTTPAAMWRLA